MSFLFATGKSGRTELHRIALSAYRWAHQRIEQGYADPVTRPETQSCRGTARSSAKDHIDLEEAKTTRAFQVLQSQAHKKSTLIYVGDASGSYSAADISQLDRMLEQDMSSLRRVERAP